MGTNLGWSPGGLELGHQPPGQASGSPVFVFEVVWLGGGPGPKVFGRNDLPGKPSQKVVGGLKRSLVEFGPQCLRCRHEVNGSSR